MLNRDVRLYSAVLSGVTASLLIFATTADAAQDQPVVVYAEPDENVRTERVSFGDLDLATVKGQRILLRRVGSAVNHVCPYGGDQIGVQQLGYRLCSDGAWQDARPQIAQAVARAKEIAMTGKSSIAATAITIRVASN
ncbi:MAG TPA: UrcA family protein [Sphingomicrobium sp.]|nr:UrcA family protein [Sphingomicrobium sp.]